MVHAIRRIENRLLEFSKIYDDRKKERETETVNNILENNNPCVNNKSKELLLNSHIETLVEIFQILDEKKMNILKSDNFNEKDIPKTLKKFVKIIKEKMTNENFQIDSGNFIDLGLKIFGELKMPEKHHVFIQSLRSRIFIPSLTNMTKKDTSVISIIDFL